MARLQPSTSVEVGDWMPRITLPLTSGRLFDSWDPTTCGHARVYWLGTPPASVVASLADALHACETLLHVVAGMPPGSSIDHSSCLLDRAGELGRAFASNGPLAIIVDAAGRVADVLRQPTPDAIAARVTQLYAASRPAVVQAKAPVLLLERVVDPGLCRTLIDYWQRKEKISNTVGGLQGNVVNGDVKRRHDVQLDDPRLFAPLRDCLVRRVVPAIQRAFHISIMVIEAPIIGCYDVVSGGRFGRHRDNTSSYTAHRQFALSLNLNPDEEYAGGELRFPEFGRELYRPVAGGALVFSSSLLHEVVPLTRGRRFGVFTFLSASGSPVRPSAQYSQAPLPLTGPWRGRGT
jgi:predicted 2-oxoglutarate/Fe(II)-dependent dioxygenase YbiX